MIDRVSRDLFRRHVPGRADHHRRIRGQPKHAGDPEIENLQPSRTIEDEVGGFDVSMHQLHLVRVAGTGAQLLHPAELVGKGDGGLSSDEAGEGFTGHVLHHDERLRVVLAEVVDRDDIRVAQRRGSACLARESFAGVGQIEIASEHFDRDHAAEDGIVGHIHCAHAPATKFSLDLVPTDLGTRLEHPFPPGPMLLLRRASVL